MTSLFQDKSCRGGGSHAAQSRSLSAFSVRTPACLFISKPTYDSHQRVRMPLFQSKMTHEVLMLIVSVFFILFSKIRFSYIPYVLSFPRREKSMAQVAV